MVAEPHDAIVVGAGHNGLVAAWYLAKAGLRIVVLERRSMVGGAAITEELFQGYRFSTCSYICHLLQARVIEDMQLPRHGFQVYRMRPRNFHPFPDGRHLLTWQDDAKTAAEISRFSERDAQAFPRFADMRRRIAGLIYPYFLKPPPGFDELRAHARAGGEEALLERSLTGTVRELLDEFFESEEVKASLVTAWDVGDPDAPGSLLAAAYDFCGELQPDEYYGLVRGGMGAITQAMANAAAEAGATVRTGTEVRRIIVEGDAAAGVELTSGETLRSRLVLSNADPKRTFLGLVEQGVLDATFVFRVRSLTQNAASYKFFASLGELPDFSHVLGAAYPPQYLAYVHICPSIDYYREAWLAAQAGRYPSGPIMAVQIPSVYDPTMAPPGRHAMSVWGQYAPVSANGASADELRRQAGELTIETLSQYAPNIREAIIDWAVFTPSDIEQRVGITGGNIRHIDMVPGQMYDERPLAGWSRYRTPVSGLYLCGAGAHPGGEVTGAPGHNAAQAVLEDLAGRER